MPRPKLNPTAEQRLQVKTLAAVGVLQEQIARRVGIRSVKTLRKHYRQELDDGTIEANASVAKSLYQSAISGNILATIFWLKCRAGWKEQHNFAGPAAAPPPFVVAKEESPQS
jgi:hypothetical protein